MKIIYVQGDLLESPERFLLHGVNASNRFGSGVAGQIKKRYPKAAEAYHKAFEDGTPELGSLVFHRESDRTIIHAFTQATCGYDGGLYVDYEAIRAAFKNLRKWFSVHMPLFFVPHAIPVAMPKIGAGLGGGDWGTISAIIEEECRESIQPVVYQLENK